MRVLHPVVGPAVNLLLSGFALLGRESLETTEIHTRVSIAKLTEIHAATHPGARLQNDQALLEALIEADADRDD